ncbi:MAG TPA: MerR family transcriptional regulator [Gammaproteobacteria bacterium]|nr:MerR family transcriptional regulator [Gammaproteobacteria bacterium]
MPKKKQNVPYTEAFRKEAVRRSDEEGVTAIQVAKELGLHVNQIYNWRNQFKRLSDKQFNSLNGVDYSKDESEEIRQLKREVKALKEERDFLK